jgi:hypothetical protein
MGGDVDMDFQSMRGPPRRSIISPCFNCYVSFPVAGSQHRRRLFFEFGVSPVRVRFFYERYFFPQAKPTKARAR